MNQCKHFFYLMDMRCQLKHGHGNLHEYYFPFSDDLIIWESGSYNDKVGFYDGKMIHDGDD